MQWALDTLQGKPTEQKATMNGIVNVPASTGDRVYLWEKLAAYGFGKPLQALEHSGQVAVIDCILKSSDDD